MFKAHKSSSFDPEQMELMAYAQKRIRQKRNWFNHGAIFFIGSIILWIMNMALRAGIDTTFFGYPWFVSAVLLWFALWLYHGLSVFVFNRFLGDAWGKKQIDILMAKQEKKIIQLQAKLKDKKEIIDSKQSGGMNNTAKVIMIVAASDNNVIGKDNHLIWRLKSDLQRFKTMTSGHTIIMGRKTFESFPKPLPNRKHIVISRQKDYHVPEGVLLAHSINEALLMGQELGQTYVIGGGEIYKQAMPFCDTIELTRVNTESKGDTFFPNLDMQVWKLLNKESHQADKDNEFDYSFLTYKKN